MLTGLVFSPTIITKKMCEKDVQRLLNPQVLESQRPDDKWGSFRWNPLHFLIFEALVLLYLSSKELSHIFTSTLRTIRKIFGIRYA
jgi:hypothetical protein